MLAVIGRKTSRKGQQRPVNKSNGWARVPIEKLEVLEIIKRNEEIVNNDGQANRRICDRSTDIVQKNCDIEEH